MVCYKFAFQTRDIKSPMYNEVHDYLLGMGPQVTGAKWSQRQDSGMKISIALLVRLMQFLILTLPLFTS